MLAVGFIDFDGLGRIFLAEGGDDEDADVILILFGAAVLGVTAYSAVPDR